MCFYSLVPSFLQSKVFKKAQYGAKVVKKQKITPPEKLNDVKQHERTLRIRRNTVGTDAANAIKPYIRH